MTLNSYAQPSEIFEKDWYLRYVNIEGQNYYPPTNFEFPYARLNFEEQNLLFTTIYCNELFGEVAFDDNWNFSFVNGLLGTLILCEPPEIATFESIYFGFYMNDVDENFGYSIGIVDPNDFYFLEVSSASGDYAIYEDYILSSYENSFTNISIYPNPVKDKFYISSTTEYDFLIAIYDIKGNLILAENNKTTGESINVQNLESGIYFVSMEDETGNTSIKRMIKK